MASYVEDNFVPVKIRVKEQPAAFKRFGAQWTPTLVVLDADSKESHRFEGYLPAEEFLAQLHFGLAQAEFKREAWAEAETSFRELVKQFPKSDPAPEALYWAGVAKYKGSGDASVLAETARLLEKQYPASTWAKKASVWAAR